MRPPKHSDSGQSDMFRERLDAFINLEHELVRLARLIDWRFIEERCGAAYSDAPGHPPLPTRLMAFERLQPFALVARDTRLAAAVDVGLLHPLIKRLRRAADAGDYIFNHERALATLKAMEADGQLDAAGRTFMDAVAKELADPTLQGLQDEISVAQGRGDHRLALRFSEELAISVEQREAKEGNGAAKRTIEALGQLTWAALLSGDHHRAKDVSERASRLAPSELWIETNLAHALLLTGDETAARVLYSKHKGRRLSEQDSRLWQDAIREDFVALRKAGVNHPQMNAIVEEFEK